MHISNLRIGGTIAALALAAAVWLGAPLSAQDAQEAGEGDSADTPRPIVSTHDLMELFNEPLYNDLKEVMSGELEGDDWGNVEHQAHKAAEIANLVAIRESDQPDEWRSHAAALQRAAVELAEAAKTQKPDPTRQAYGGVINACNRCHDTFAPEEAPNLEP